MARQSAQSTVNAGLDIPKTSLLSIPLEIRSQIYDDVLPAEINVLYDNLKREERSREEVRKDHLLGVCPEFHALLGSCRQIQAEILAMVFRTRIARFEAPRPSAKDTLALSIRWLTRLGKLRPDAHKDAWYGVAVCLDVDSFTASDLLDPTYLHVQEL